MTCCTTPSSIIVNSSLQRTTQICFLMISISEITEKKKKEITGHKLLLPKSALIYETELIRVIIIV